MKTKRGGFMIGIGAAVGIMLAAAGPVWADFVAASGGSYTNIYTVNGVTYRAHVFTNTGDKTFTVTTGGAVEVLVVGGGGGGGYNYGGGGGGGWVTLSTVTLTNGSYTVTVGAGGARSGNNGSPGTDGNPSSAFGLTAPGGCGGGSYAIGAGSGYVGGGGCIVGAITNAGTGSSPGGNGGNGNSGSSGGGGGGANGNGQAATASKCGDGGVGVTNDYLNGTSTGYGGGGGGGTVSKTESWRGLAVCGGGNGAVSNAENAVDGTPGTGGGGGGQANASGGNGGSGIVIVRYATNSTVPLVYTLEATDLTTNSATLNGSLAYLPGSQTATIRVYWGTNDAGKTAAGWMYTNDVASGVVTAGANYSYPATSLSTDLYYYRYYATNTAGSGEYWGDVRKFQLSAADLGLAVYGYRAMTKFQWQDSVQGTSWSDVTNGTNWNLRVTKAMYTAKPYYRVRMILASFPPVYSGTAKVTDPPPGGMVIIVE